jgi:hypothetical protein
MNYLYAWLGAGALTLVFILGAHLLSPQQKSAFVHDLLESANPERRKLSYRVLSNLVVPALAGILIVIAWPVALYMKLKDWIRSNDERESGDNPDKRFSVLKSYLKERLSLQEIERREMVTDPLHAVPALPFGHLHSTWCAFTQDLTPDSELWSFSTTWENGWGIKEWIEGYVVVCDGIPGTFLLTVRSRLDSKE